MAEWHVVSPEYPPQVGGVGDYSYLLASALAEAGDKVHIWSRACEQLPPHISGVEVHRELGAFRPGDLRRAGRLLDAYPAPRHILLQWVPHGYGYKSLNAAFCLWLWARSLFHGDRIDVMVHEPFLTFHEGNWRQDAAAVVHRLMILLILDAARQVWVSIPAWASRLKPYAIRRKFTFQWLPIPSTIRPIDDPEGVAIVRARHLQKGRVLLGHFGMYGPLVTPTLEACLPQLLFDRLDRGVLLMGKGSDLFRDAFVKKWPSLAAQVSATGSLSSMDLSRHLQACDLMIQPYKDGISSRRTSAMAGLAHGLALVTTGGPNTEAFWSGNKVVALAAAGDNAALSGAVESLLSDEGERRRMAQAARTFYQERFDLHRALAAVRQPAN